MSENQNKLRTFRNAIEHMAEQALRTTTNVKNAEAWLIRVKGTMRADHYVRAMELLDQEPELDHYELASLLNDERITPTPTPTVRHVADRAGCRTCGCYGGGGWMPSPDRDHDGMTPDLVPCPTCASDRHRRHEIMNDVQERERLHNSHRAAVQVVAALGTNSANPAFLNYVENLVERMKNRNYIEPF